MRLLHLADPRHVTPLLAAVARRAHGKRTSLARVRITIVRDQFNEHRNLALLYELTLVHSGRSSRRRWRGNANADAAVIARRHRMLSYLYRRLPRGTVPRPLALSRSWHLSLYEEATGSTPQQLFDAGRKAAGLMKTRLAVQPLGRWLRRLHRLNLPANLGPRWFEAAPLRRTIGRAARAAARLNGRAAADLTRLGGDLHQLRPPAGAKVLLHGDLQLGNVVVHQRDVTIIDFSDACSGDRWIDVAGFLLHLEELLRYPFPQTHETIVATLSKQFLAAYGQPRSPAERKRFAWATAAVAIRAASYVATATGRHQDNLSGLRRLCGRARVALEQLSR